MPLACDHHEYRGFRPPFHLMLQNWHEHVTKLTCSQTSTDPPVRTLGCQQMQQVLLNALAQLAVLASSTLHAQQVTVADPARHSGNHIGVPYPTKPHNSWNGCFWTLCKITHSCPTLNTLQMPSLTRKLSNASLCMWREGF